MRPLRSPGGPMCHMPPCAPSWLLSGRGPVCACARLYFTARRAAAAHSLRSARRRESSLMSRVESLSHSAGREKHTLDSIERDRVVSLTYT